MEGSGVGGVDVHRVDLGARPTSKAKDEGVSVIGVNEGAESTRSITGIAGAELSRSKLRTPADLHDVVFRVGGSVVKGGIRKEVASVGDIASSRVTPGAGLAITGVGVGGSSIKQTKTNKAFGSGVSLVVVGNSTSHGLDGGTRAAATDNSRGGDENGVGEKASARKGAPSATMLVEGVVIRNDIVVAAAEKSAASDGQRLAGSASTQERAQAVISAAKEDFRSIVELGTIVGTDAARTRVPSRGNLNHALPGSVGHVVVVRTARVGVAADNGGCSKLDIKMPRGIQIRISVVGDTHKAVVVGGKDGGLTVLSPTINGGD